MPPQRSWTESTHSSRTRKADQPRETASSPPFTTVDAASPQKTMRSRSQFKGPTDNALSSAPRSPNVRSRCLASQPDGNNNRQNTSSPSSSSDIREVAATSLDPAPTSSPSAPPRRKQGAVPLVAQFGAVAPPAVAPPVLSNHKPATNAPVGSPPKRATFERTHVVWMFVGDAPSITRTSPTPPPLPLPESRMLRRPPTPMRTPSPPRPFTAGPSPLRQSSGRRTLEEYDQTNARIRTLNEELLADPASQPRHDRPPPAGRALRSDRGVGIRYLNVPGAATDAQMAVRRRAARRRTSASSTGIVDISDSESSQFESDDDNDEESKATPPPPLSGGSRALKVGTVAEPRSANYPRVSGGIPRERPGRAAAPAEPQDRVSVGGRCHSITRPPPPTDARGQQPQPFRPGSFLRDRAAPYHRPQPAHRLASLFDAPLPTPDRKGKKRARDPDSNGGGLWLDSDHADGSAREGKRRNVAPRVSLSQSVTTPPSRPARPSGNASRNPLDTSTSRLRD